MVEEEAEGAEPEEGLEKEVEVEKWAEKVEKELKWAVKEVDEEVEKVMLKEVTMEG